MKDVVTFKVDENSTLLSEKEIGVLQYVANGLTSKEIAVELNQSSRNVDNIKSKIIKKTDAKNILEVIVALYKKGIIV